MDFSLMNKFVAPLCVALFSASSAFALVGGPWDGNVPGNTTVLNPSSIDGTYQGTVKGTNISGIMVFATTTAGTSGTAGTTTTVTNTTTTTTTTSTTRDTTTTTTTTPSTTQGYALIYLEGKITTSEVIASIDLGGRKVFGVLEGAGLRALPLTLTRPATSTTAAASWSVTDSAYFTGTFSAKLSDDWASNSYKGKGTLMVTKVDLSGFAQQLIANPTTATPQIVTVPTSVKVSGVKTSDTANSYTVSLASPTEPTITPE
jgi:hypothetical protein